MIMSHEVKNRMDKFRVITLLVLAFVLFLVLIIRFYSLQVVNYSTYRSEAVGNMLNRIDISAPRGIVYDRQGKSSSIMSPVIIS